MQTNFLKIFLISIIALSSILQLNAQNSTDIPTTAISNMPVVSMEQLNLNREDYTILNTINSVAVVTSENKKTSRSIMEQNGEFKLRYNIIKIKGERYLEYDECSGVVRLGYLGGTGIVSSDSDYMPAEEIVRRLALYRLINMAKEYGADLLFQPTITTTATSSGKIITYKTEASAKLIKISIN